ncbi:MAG: EamA family transporter RarD [Opitutales bacterium]|nr:EamA family transporter RarD [Opitutales bacterium]
MDNKSGDSLTGGIAAAASFFIWGLIPMYWKLLESVNAYELVLHRIAWSFFFLLLILRYRGKLKAYFLVFRGKRLALIHAFGGVMLAINWLAFIYAVTNGQILQASLAYFIVPLVNLGFGFIVLKEGLTWLRGLAVLLACVGVLNEVFGVDEVPWLALTIAGSFGVYGLLKKKSSMGTVTGLALENTVIFPIALVGLVWLFSQNQGALFHAPWSLQALILLTGIVTSIPLLLFSYGARRIQLNTLGILQFIAPCMKFGLAVWLYNEPFSSSRMVTFVFIWAGIAFYLFDAFRSSRIKDVPPDL